MSIASTYLQYDVFSTYLSTLSFALVPRVVVGENVTFKGPEEYVKSQGVELVNLHDSGCIDMMSSFIARHPSLWNEDIGVPDDDKTAVTAASSSR